MLVAAEVVLDVVVLAVVILAVVVFAVVVFDVVVVAVVVFDVAVFAVVSYFGGWSDRVIEIGIRAADTKYFLHRLVPDTEYFDSPSVPGWSVAVGNTFAVAAGHRS